MGADDGRALAMAVVDAAFNADVAECEMLSERLEALECEQAHALAKEAALHAATSVSFSTMEGQ
jgi:alpha-D-ribose 1-methylphosphonate 5-triphosphate synthase subunit PhnG